jgi:thymidylate synthase ThyX
VIEATVIRDSISNHGVRLVTMKLRYPKFIHGEFMTHRVFSRNASSSRAVPTAKLIQEVRSNALRAYPVSWGQNQKGMQAGGELSGDTLNEVKRAWNAAAYDAAYWAETMMLRGAHKQVVNRLLEPFSHINVVVSATEWMNFFGLRLSKDAQPEMRALAEAMWAAFKESVPLRLGHGQWHLPFVDEDSLQELRLLYGYEHIGQDRYLKQDIAPVIEKVIKVSIARCARVSYESFETGKRSTVAEDIALHDRLLASRHLSPFEHVATPDERGYQGQFVQVVQVGTLVPPMPWKHPEEHGNFNGWRQRRKQIEGEAVPSMPIETGEAR